MICIKLCQIRRSPLQPIVPRFRSARDLPGGYLPAEFLLAMPTSPIRPMTTTHTATGTEP